MIQARVKRYMRCFLGVRRGWVEYHGSRVYFPAGSYAAKAIMVSGTYEHEIQAILLSAARRDTVVFDIGANIGVSVIPLLSRGDGCRVVSIEASPNVLPFLARTHSECPHKGRWEIVRKAVTDRAGESISCTVHRSGGDVYDGIKHTGRADSAETITVPTTTVDAEWEERGRPTVSLIKIDTEGAEIGVLKGAKECVQVCRPSIITEWSPKNFVAYGNDPSDMWTLARDFGYDVFAIPTMAPVLSPNVLPSLLELHENLLLIPR